MKKWLLGLVILVTITINPVFADQPQPDDIEVLAGTKNYGNIIETGDLLVLISYEISYTVIPTFNSNEGFIIRLLQGAVELANTNPHVRSLSPVSGYERSLSTFYFTADEASVLGISASTPLIVRIQGSPLVFDTPQTNSFNITNFTAINTKDTFAGDILIQIQDLQNQWDVTLIEGTSFAPKLTVVGEDYMISIFSRIIEVVPQFFTQVIVNSDPGERSKPIKSQTGSIMEGSPFNSFMTELGVSLGGLPLEAVSTFVALALSIAFAIFLSVISGGRKEVGLIVFPLSFISLVIIGFSNYTIFGIFTAIYVVAVGFPILRRIT